MGYENGEDYLLSSHPLPYPFLCHQGTNALLFSLVDHLLFKAH